MICKRINPHTLIGDLGYKIARFKIAENIYYRPSHNGSFITAPLGDLNEAKTACDEHAKDNPQ